MAVALATLPLNRVLAGAGDALLTTGAGVGLTTGFAVDLVAGLTGGLATGFAACLATGLAGGAFLATTLVTGFAAGFLTAALLGLVLLTTTFLVAAFLGAGFFATAFPAATFFTATFFTADFFTAAFFTAAFFTTGFRAGLAFFAGDLAGAFLTAGLAAAFLAAAGLAAIFFAVVLLAALRLVFAGALLALFTVRPLLPAVFDLPALTSAEVLPFCALAAVELRVVFAISLHRFWPWRPGVIAQVSYTSKPASGILVPLPVASRSGTVNVLTRLILWMLRLYKRWLSPLLGPRCRFHPTCSDYARIAVTRFGPWRGSLLTGWRLLRCQPLCTGGEDPVPDDFHFPRCRCQEDPPDIH